MYDSHERLDRPDEWIIVYGRNDGVEGYALCELNRIVQKYVPYLVRVIYCSKVDDKILSRNLIVIGTQESNNLIKELIDRENFKSDTNQNEGFSIYIKKNPNNLDRQIVVLSGTDENGVLYAVRDFEHYVIDRSTKVDSAGILYQRPFVNNFEEVTLKSSPMINFRGLWTWGHVIYDYKRYLDNMSRWKMNIIVIWNDFAPINASDIVSYAHKRGIKVIWGYSWGWGEQLNPTSDEEMKVWASKVVEKYKEEYEKTGCDGIYFQIFTETNDTEIKGESIAKLATRWVNYIASKVLDKYPDIWILFGVHATSIRGNYKELKDVNSRMSIIWEDVGLPLPSFPYSYNPDIISGYETSLDYTSKIARLRGEKEDFGIVIKGMINLDWKNFEHQSDSFILGEWDSGYINRRSKEKIPRWKYVEKEWRKNMKCVTEILKVILEANPARTTVLGLVEDGLWEEKMWLPVALLAEAMWNPYISPKELIERVSETEDAFKLV